METSSSRPLNVLVTGGSGFIGTYVTKIMERKGNNVVNLDVLEGGHGSHARCRLGVEDTDKFLDVLYPNRDLDCLIHLAAVNRAGESMRNPGECFSTNIKGTQEVFLAAARHGVKRIVYASSAAVYGENRGDAKLFDEWYECRPVSHYGLSKKFGEDLLGMMTRSGAYDLSAISLRYASVYGPGQTDYGEDSAVIRKFIKNALSGRPLTVYGDGSQTRPFTYVEDVAMATCMAAEIPLLKNCHEVVNITSGESSRVIDVANFVKASLGDNVIIQTGHPAPYKEVSSCDMTCMKMWSMLNFYPQVSLDDGIHAMAKWMKDSYNPYVLGSYSGSV